MGITVQENCIFFQFHLVLPIFLSYSLKFGMKIKELSTLLNTSIPVDCLPKTAHRFGLMLNTFDHEHF